MSFPRYPAYKDSGVEWLGQVPAHWAVKPLKHLADFVNGDAFKPSEWADAGVPIIRIQNLNGGEDFNYFGGEVEERYLVREDDLLFGWSGNRGTSFGPFIWRREGVYALNQHIFRVVPRSMDRRELYWVLKAVTAHVEDQAHGIIGMVHITKGDLGAINVPVPSRDEQAAISAFLDRETAKIDALIAEQERLIELLKEKRQAVISHAVTKGLDPDLPMKDSGFEWLGKVPAHWSVRPLWSLSSVVRGASPRPAGDSRFFHGDHTPWVTVAEITKDASPDLTETSELLTAEGASMSRLFRAGTIIYSNSGATLGVPKRLCIDACANDGVVGFENLSNNLLAMFLYHYLGALTSTMREMVKQGAGQPNLNTDIVKAVRIPLPTVAEQERICAHVENMSNLFETLMADIWRSVTLLRQRRAALITSAIAGQIDCRGLDVATAHAACVEFD